MWLEPNFSLLAPGTAYVHDAVPDQTVEQSPAAHSTFDNYQLEMYLSSENAPDDFKWLSIALLRGLDYCAGRTGGSVGKAFVRKLLRVHPAMSLPNLHKLLSRGEKAQGYLEQPWLLPLAALLTIHVRQKRSVLSGWHGHLQIAGFSEIVDRKAELALRGRSILREACVAVVNGQSLPTRMGAALEQLGEIGIMHLLGMRRTSGTLCGACPPSLSTLISAFQQPHNLELPQGLTVGGRALCKHVPRCEKSFWRVGVAANAKSDGNKNKAALELLRLMIFECVWVNVHYLPHEVPVLELRIASGYGMRWSADGATFRGFLEPHMEDGWENKWRH